MAILLECGAFFLDHFPEMKFFTRPVVATSESAVLDPHLKSAELRLVQVEKELEQLEEAFNKTFRAIANHDEFRRRLVSEQACITARRSVLLEERARLLKSLGRIH